MAFFFPGGQGNLNSLEKRGILDPPGRIYSPIGSEEPSFFL